MSTTFGSHPKPTCSASPGDFLKLLCGLRK
jgi:hypothetical protein